MDTPEPAAAVTGISRARVRSVDGAEADLELNIPRGACRGVFWLPALGMPMRHYQAFSDALARMGIASARHEWRGCGSSSLRATRDVDWSYRQILEQDLPASFAVARREAPQIQWCIGGHSLGAQMASLFSALNPDLFSALLIVAGGTPYWRNFPGVQAPLLRLLATLVPGLSNVFGYFPGRRLGFAGREARGVMRDWSGSARGGNYAACSGAVDVESAMARLDIPVLAVWMARDAYTPRASLEHLLGKLGRAPRIVRALGVDMMGEGNAGHFAWMKHPQPVVHTIADGIAQTFGDPEEQAAVSVVVDATD